MRSRSVLFLLLLLGVPLAGCGSNGTPPAKGGVPVVGQLAPEIEGVDIDGQRFKLSDYRGKVVVLDFWGNW
jgi:cytochrome oxidase Cu insertion factor (SCO1/SenC/PrrC family)